MPTPSEYGLAIRHNAAHHRYEVVIDTDTRYIVLSQHRTREAARDAMRNIHFDFETYDEAFDGYTTGGK